MDKPTFPEKGLGARGVWTGGFPGKKIAGHVISRVS